ncbi:TetR family transcriptional regulator [Streptomyces sp. NBC_00006]|uniref:TetR/AcrR family transcriptional regulator n=1 Tax=Streptomyces sp. NBC_00006 TaxID=2975619 RepID=UPI0022552CEA|nr:TetR/AcrR family transcriptional regulator [Streptomyces sp. NBC_00006]MCX5536214.1 TetR family transcriptional regulator [Streptomyces sp. NBC_00006]
MPTGVAIRDVREQLFDAAERVLMRDGAAALTSRAVTTEAGCAKGVLHRHFADFDAFLADLVIDRAGRMEERAAALVAAAGTRTVVDLLTNALTDLFTPVVVAMVGLLTFRDGLRARLRAAGRPGVTVLSDATAMLRSYLEAERQAGRLTPDTDIDSLGLTLIGSGHLLYANREDGPPAEADVRRVVTSAVAGALPR